MKHRGFTLIETLAVVAILGLVSLAITSAITYFYKSNRAVMQSIAATNTARTAGSDFVGNIHQANYGDDGSYPLLSTASSSITFFSNTDADTSIEKVRWFLNSGTLYRGVTQFSGSNYDSQPEKINALFIFVQNTATTSLFQYFDGEGVELASSTDITEVRSVKMNIVVGIQSTTSAATSTTFTLESFASFRIFTR